VPKKQHEQLSAVLSELHVQQSNELLSGQLTLLPGLLFEQLQQLSMLVPEQAIHTAARARQATRSARQTNGPSHFPEHPMHCAEWLRTADMFLILLTSSFVHSQPLWQDHLHVSQLEAQPLAPGCSSRAPQQANITSASFVTPGG